VFVYKTELQNTHFRDNVQYIADDHCVFIEHSRPQAAPKLAAEQNLGRIIHKTARLFYG